MKIRLFGLVVLLISCAAGCFSTVPGSPVLISYTEFRQQLQEGNVSEIAVTGDQISGKVVHPLTRQDSDGKKSAHTDFVTYLPSFGDAGLFPLLQQKNVIVKTFPAGRYPWSDLTKYLPWVILIIILALFMFRGTRVQSGDPQSIKESGAHLYEKGLNRTMFNDVAGAQGAKAELQDIIQFLKNPQQYQRLGGKTPRGALLVGAPGTGKTLLARAVAGEANVPFFSISGSNFMEMYVGVGAARVRSMFAQAKKVAPSIIFIDEIDSLGRHRGLGSEGTSGEREQTLNQLLSEMDGFEVNTSVIVMAATNRPDILDPALLRPGRFDRHITVDLPSLQDRLEILTLHARNKPLEPTVALKEIARSTPGFSGADLANLLNEAAILAARKGKDAIGEEDIQESRDKVVMGLERKGVIVTDEEKRLIAYHEGGHAVLAVLLPSTDPLYKVTILPRGRSMGVTQQVPEQDKNIFRMDYVLDRLAVMLGGRAAEMLVFGTATSGAESDLKEAMNLARRMILDWGMGQGLRNIALGGQSGSYLQEGGQKAEYSEVTATQIDQEVKSILDEAFRKASATLKGHRPALDRLAEVLIEREEMAGSDVVALVKSFQ